MIGVPNEIEFPETNLTPSALFKTCFVGVRQLLPD